MRTTTTALALMLLPEVAAAQVYLGNGQLNTSNENEKKDSRAQSHQAWALQLDFSPYLPALDNDPALGGATPFTDIFGDKRSVMMRADLEYQALRLGSVGSLAGGVGLGYFQKKGFGLDAEGQPTQDTNRFKIIPMSLDAVVRVDYLLQKGVPLAPFIKGGLDLYYWGNKKNGEFTKFAGSGNDVRGTTAGFHGAAGLAIDLGFIDPSGAVNMDHSFGVNRSYLVASAELSKVNDFNSGQSFDFSATLFNVGLALEF